jgi:ketosteroid isomerase-like protein
MGTQMSSHFFNSYDMGNSWSGSSGSDPAPPGTKKGEKGGRKGEKKTKAKRAKEKKRTKKGGKSRKSSRRKKRRSFDAAGDDSDVSSDGSSSESGEDDVTIVPHAHFFVPTRSNTQPHQAGLGYGPLLSDEAVRDGMGFLAHLPSEVLVEILRRLRLVDVLKLSVASKGLFALCSDDFVWEQYYAAALWHTRGEVDREIIDRYLRLNPSRRRAVDELVARSGGTLRYYDTVATAAAQKSPEEDDDGVGDGVVGDANGGDDNGSGDDAAAWGEPAVDGSTFMFGRDFYERVSEGDLGLREFHCCWKQMFILRYQHPSESGQRISATIAMLYGQMKALETQKAEREKIALQRQRDGDAKVRQKERLLAAALRVVLFWALFQVASFDGVLGVVRTCFAVPTAMGEPGISFAGLPELASSLVHFILFIPAFLGSAFAVVFLCGATVAAFTSGMERLVVRVDPFHRGNPTRRYQWEAAQISRRFDGPIREARERRQHYIDHQDMLVRRGIFHTERTAPPRTPGKTTCAVM